MCANVKVAYRSPKGLQSAGTTAVLHSACSGMPISFPQTWTANMSQQSWLAYADAGKMFSCMVQDT